MDKNESEEMKLYVKEFILSERDYINEIILTKYNMKFIRQSRKMETEKLFNEAKRIFNKIETGQVKSKDLEKAEENLIRLLVAIGVKEKIKIKEQSDEIEL